MSLKCRHCKSKRSLLGRADVRRWLGAGGWGDDVNFAALPGSGSAGAVTVKSEEPAPSLPSDRCCPRRSARRAGPKAGPRRGAHAQEGGTGRGSSGRPGGCLQKSREPVRRLSDPRRYGTVAFPAEAPWFTRGWYLRAGPWSGGVQTAVSLLPRLFFLWQVTAVWEMSLIFVTTCPCLNHSGALGADFGASKPCCSAAAPPCCGRAPRLTLAQPGTSPALPPGRPVTLPRPLPAARGRA